MKWLKNRARFYLSCNISEPILFSENEKSYVQEPSNFSMLESKLWPNKTNQKCKGCKWWDLPKLAANTLASLILVLFSAP